MFLSPDSTSCLHSIQVYSSVDTAVQNLLVLLTPAGGPVLSLKHLGSSLFAGLANGSVAVFHQRPGGELRPPAAHFLDHAPCV